MSSLAGTSAPPVGSQLSVCTFVNVFQLAPALRLQGSAAVLFPSSSFSSWSLTVLSSPSFPQKIRHLSPRKDRKDGFVWILALAEAFSGLSSTMYMCCGFWKKNLQKGMKLPCYGPRGFNSLPIVPFSNLWKISSWNFLPAYMTFKWLFKGRPSLRVSCPLFFLHCSLSFGVPSWTFTL